MDSQDPNNWQLPLLQLLVDPNQLSTSKWRAQDEIGPSERHVQLQIESDISQFSLSVLQLKNKALMIVLESEPTFSGNYQMVFKKCFENNTKEQMINHISGDGGYLLWLQGRFNLLTMEQRENYIAIIFLCILEFLSIQINNCYDKILLQ